MLTKHNLYIDNIVQLKKLKCLVKSRSSVIVKFPVVKVQTNQSNYIQGSLFCGTKIQGFKKGIPGQLS